MSLTGLWLQLSRGVRVLVRRGESDRELEAEVEHWLDLAAAELQATGVSPQEARRRARAELGSPLAAREQVRAHGWERIVGGAAADLTYAAR